MRYVMFEGDGGARVGALADGGMVADLTSLFPGAPETIEDVILGGEVLAGEIRESLANGAAPLRPLGETRLLRPFARPGKFICLGLNYASHAKEGGHEVPDYPSLFVRVPSSLIGPDEGMVVPVCSERLDYEAELVVVVGRTCRNVPEEQALDMVYGYTAFNDGSVRDYQRKTAQWTAGKNFDGTGALGPWVVTADELPPGAKGLGIRSRLNGNVMQESNTEHMLFPVARTIAILSEIMTLEPGDLIATGTPEGVGHARKPPVWMRPGDEIEVEIDGIGVLRNPIVAAEASSATAAA